jgi:hypothetical protein
MGTCSSTWAVDIRSKDIGLDWSVDIRTMSMDNRIVDVDGVPYANIATVKGVPIANTKMIDGILAKDIKWQVTITA